MNLFGYKSVEMMCVEYMVVKISLLQEGQYYCHFSSASMS